MIAFLKDEIKTYWPESDRSVHFADAPPTVILVAGINGCGKTTSVAKLAYRFKQDGKKVVLAAADTFLVWDDNLSVNNKVALSAIEAVLNHDSLAGYVGDEHVALGCDWDGFIVTPHDMRTVSDLPVLVQHMLDRGFSPERIGRILSGNALRVLATR